MQTHGLLFAIYFLFSTNAVECKQNIDENVLRLFKILYKFGWKPGLYDVYVNLSLIPFLIHCQIVNFSNINYITQINSPSCLQVLVFLPFVLLSKVHLDKIMWSSVIRDMHSYIVFLKYLIKWYLCGRLPMHGTRKIK